MKLFQKAITILILSALLLATMPVQPAYAATITVTNNNDSGAGSLRQAIADAASGDIITFNGDYTITLTSDMLDIDKTLTIDGSGHTITIDGADSFLAIFIFPGQTVSLNNLTVTNGYSAVAGGIYNLGTLTISNSTVSDNSSNVIAGGIYNSGILTLNNSTLSGNSSTSGGGGIYNDGTLTLNNTTFSGNTANDHGGGIYNDGTLTLNNSTLSDNSARFDGGGIYNNGTLTLNNTTFSSNIVNNNGGGIYNRGVLHLSNSILANSTSASGEDCYNETGDTITTNTNNLIETNGASGHQCGTPALNADPQLGALADNGGDTQTFALLSGSPAIDAGDNASCESTDQRGVTRPQGTSCDIGAYELESLDTLAPTVQSTSLVASYSGSGPSTIKVIFSEAVKSDASTGAANNIANYLLVEDGDNDSFDTTTCAIGHVADDLSFPINTATYDAATRTATLTVNGGTPLPVGRYMVFACGTTSIEDLAGNELNGGLSDTSITFTVIAAASSLPATGFRHGQVTSLPKQPAAKAYTATDMLLEIPKLGVSMPIVGVPQSENGWDVSWLGNSAGYLAGSAFPTWAGNTVITGHVWDAYNQPGLFAELKTLKHGDQIHIQAWGQTYSYEVRESNLVTTKNVNAAFQSEEYDWLTLITCEFYNPFSGEYLFRRAVRAVLVSVQ